MNINLAVFDTRSDQAYIRMGALPARLQWSAFDVSKEDASRGRATLFVMAVWNGAYDKELDKYTTWDICQDPSTNAYWYKVPRDFGDTHNASRTALWNSLHIATRHGLRMRAMLKDGRTRRCSVRHHFEIEKVVYERDGSALWVKLLPGSDGVGAGTCLIDLSHLDDLPVDSPLKPNRSAKLTPTQYRAAADLAEEVRSGAMSRAAAVAQLHLEQSITESSAGALLNNYRCLLAGQTYKAPMSADATAYFLHKIICIHGNKAISPAAAALRGYIEYASGQWGQVEPMRKLLAGLEADEAQIIVLAEAEAALRNITHHENVRPALPTQHQEGAVDTRQSEIERLVWTRGPQHREFRQALLDRWDRKCSVHGAECNGQLIASHIVAWSQDESLRGNPNNGLLLVVPLDNLFDRGLISFDDEGKLLTSSALTSETAKHFGLSPSLEIAWHNLQPFDRLQIQKNLRRHRTEHAPLHGYRV